MDRHSAALQHSAHRYRVRRLESALLGVDRQRLRGPSPGIGWLLAAVLAVGCALLAWLRPVTVTDAPILLDAESGTLYVRLAEMLHPVLNLTSARLIAGVDAVPHPAPAAAIGRSRRGPTLGIPGAPQTPGAVLAGPLTWSVCDTGGGATAVLAGVDPAAGALIDPQQAVPVTSTASGAAYLLYRGQRIAVGPAPAVAAAHPVPVLLLGALPEAPPGTEPPDRLAVLPAAALCVHWRPDGPAGALSAGLPPLPDGVAPAALAQADGAGPALDGVYLPPGRSVYVQAVGVNGPAGARYLICDTGMRYPIDDDTVARSLGLPAEPSPVPWPILTGLPVGPLLSRDDAVLPPPGR